MIDLQALFKRPVIFSGNTKLIFSAQHKNTDRETPKPDIYCTFLAMLHRFSEHWHCLCTVFLALQRVYFDAKPTSATIG